MFEVTEATTGLPLVGANITIRHRRTGATLAVGKVTSKTTRYVDLINLSPSSFSHPIFVDMKGYTDGRVYFMLAKVTTNPTGYRKDRLFQIDVPPKDGTSIVARWQSGYDLDLFAFLPAGAPSGVVGSGRSGHPSDIGAGTLLDYPYARWYRDGGAADGDSVEVITLSNYLRTQYPHYLGVYPNGAYYFLLHGYNDGKDLQEANPFARVWINGRYYYTIYASGTGRSGDTWHGLTVITREGNSPVYWEFYECGTSEIWPYAEGGAILSANRNLLP